MELVNWFKSERENRLRGSVVMSSDRAEYFQQRAADTDSGSVNTPGRQRLSSSSAPVNKFHLKMTPWRATASRLCHKSQYFSSHWRFHIMLLWLILTKPMTPEVQTSENRSFLMIQRWSSPGLCAWSWKAWKATCVKYQDWFINSCAFLRHNEANSSLNHHLFMMLEYSIQYYIYWDYLVFTCAYWHKEHKHKSKQYNETYMYVNN